MAGPPLSVEQVRRSGCVAQEFDGAGDHTKLPADCPSAEPGCQQFMDRAWLTRVRSAKRCPLGHGSTTTSAINGNSNPPPTGAPLLPRPELSDTPHPYSSTSGIFLRIHSPDNRHSKCVHHGKRARTHSHEQSHRAGRRPARAAACARLAKPLAHHDLADRDTAGTLPGTAQVTKPAPARPGAARRTPPLQPGPRHSAAVG